MRLILVRHAQTAENTTGVLQGHLDAKLSELGRQQAKLIAERLKSESVDAIYTSDMSRCVDTTTEIAQFHPRARLQATKELRDRSLGEFQGKTKAETNWPVIREKFYTIGWKPPGGGESLEEVYSRLARFLKKAITRHKNGTTVVITHGPMLRLLICNLTNRQPTDAKDMPKLDNASISVFEPNGHGFEAVVWNDTSHLDGTRGSET